MSVWPHDFDEILRSHCRFLQPGEFIDPDAPLTALGADSIEIVDLIVSIEDRFNISFPQEFLTPQVFATASTVWCAIRPMLPAPAISEEPAG